MKKLQSTDQAILEAAHRHSLDLVRRDDLAVSLESQQDDSHHVRRQVHLEELAHQLHDVGSYPAVVLAVSQDDWLIAE